MTTSVTSRRGATPTTDVSQVLSAFNQRRGIAADRCQTGALYQTFEATSHTSVAEAVEKLRDELAAYAAGKVGTVYWRTIPELAKDFLSEEVKAYCRLVISDEPEIYPDVEALRSAKAFGEPHLPRVNQ